MITIERRIELLNQLGHFLTDLSTPEIQSSSQQACLENPWFTRENVISAFEAIRNRFLQSHTLRAWVEYYHADDNVSRHRVGLILAGNIPMVGWHDVMTNFLFNKVSLIKYSDKDKVLIPYLISKLTEMEPEAGNYFETVEKLKGYDAMIATGSNNSAVYFQYYFKHVPHLIRKNRNAIAILTGNEDLRALELLSDDIFTYFGMGCRNVSKIFVPEGYDFSNLFTAFEKHRDIIHHNKYKNNYEYNLALFLINREPHIQHDIIILKESEQIASRIASLHYQYYDQIGEVYDQIKNKEEEIQCIVTDLNIEHLKTVSFGQSQCPGIMDYADGVDTVQFLLSL